MPEYSFSTSCTEKTVTSMEIARPNMAPVFVPTTSVTISQNVLPNLAEGLSSTLSTVLSPDTSLEEITASRPLNKISPVPEIPRKYKISKKISLFFSLKELVTSRKSERSREEIKSRRREIGSVNSPNTSGLQRQKMQTKKSKQLFIFKRHLKILKRKA